MSEVHKVLLELLMEIDEICQKEGIEYYLCEDTALSANIANTFFPDCCQAKVAMTTKGYKRFERAVKEMGRQDRTLESMKNNERYPEFGARYGASNTMMLSLKPNQSLLYPVIGVVIKMIRFKPKRFNKIYRLSDVFNKYRNSTVECVSGKKKLKIKACKFFQKIVGYRRCSCLLFKLWTYRYAPRNVQGKIAIGSGKYVHKYSALFDGSRVELDGYEFPTFGKNYLVPAYGENYFTKTTSGVKASSDLLVSAVIPYNEYIKQAESIVDWDQFYSEQKEYAAIYNEVSRYNKIINGYYAIVERTEKRYALYEQYMPKKKMLLDMAHNEQYDELNEYLAPYRSALYAFYKKDLGLCFDKEIFDITMKLLEREGKQKYAERLRILVPKEHWKPIEIKDYRGETLLC